MRCILASVQLAQQLRFKSYWVHNRCRYHNGSLDDAVPAYSNLMPILDGARPDVPPKSPGFT